MDDVVAVDDESKFELPNDVFQWQEKSPERLPPASVWQSNLPAQAHFSKVYNALYATSGGGRVIVVVGETGSGKSTQVPRLLVQLLAAQRQKSAPIARVVVAEPRRIAASSLARHVADKLNIEVGGAVGYAVRYEHRHTSATSLLYMTDGVLMRQAIADHSFRGCGVVILDEVHERGANTDALLGVLRRALRLNPTLRLILMSATAHVAVFKRYFADLGSVPVVRVDGLDDEVDDTASVDSKVSRFDVGVRYEKSPVANFVWAAAEKAAQIHLSEPIRKAPEFERNNNDGENNKNSDDDDDAVLGDILVFLPGESEIRQAVEICNDVIERRTRVGSDGRKLKSHVCFRLFAGMPLREQIRVLQPCFVGGVRGQAKRRLRKIVFATNIAETSLTIDGVVYVVDSGLCKQSFFDPRGREQSLFLTPISQASAVQRAGRAGRTRHGLCYRLYTRADYEKRMPRNGVPETQRLQLTDLLLTLARVGFRDPVRHFRWPSPPPPENLGAALDTLLSFEAIRIVQKKQSSLLSLTEAGAFMTSMPVSAAMSRAVFLSMRPTSVEQGLGCTDDLLLVGALLEQPNAHAVWKRSRNASEWSSAVEAWNEFLHPSGDHMTLVQLLRAFIRVTEDPNEYATYLVNTGREGAIKRGRNEDDSSAIISTWCHNKYVSRRVLESAVQAYRQLRQMCARWCSRLHRRHVKPHELPNLESKEDSARAISMCLASANPFNLVRFDAASNAHIRVWDEAEVYFHPSSRLRVRTDAYLVFHQVLRTHKRHLCFVSVLPPVAGVAAENQLRQRQQLSALTRETLAQRRAAFAALGIAVPDYGDLTRSPPVQEAQQQQQQRQEEQELLPETTVEHEEQAPPETVPIATTGGDSDDGFLSDEDLF